MKNYETGIIIAVIVVLGYMWWKNSQTAVANPTNAASPGYRQGDA